MTYRAWDHARLPRRQLGAAEALLSVPLAGSVEKDFRVIPEPGPISCLARSEAFTAWRLTACDAPVERNTDDRVRTLHIIEGTAQIDGAGGALRLKRGQSALLPAQLGAWTFNGNAVAVEAAPVWCSKAELTARSEALHRFLVGTKPLWEPRPFENPAPHWTHSHRELTAFLDALDDDALSALEADPDRLRHTLAPWLRGCPQRRLSRPCPHQCPIHRNRPGRHACSESSANRSLSSRPGKLGPPSGSAVDWCAGKGHLSRALAERFGLAVRALEKKSALIAAGQRLTEGQRIAFHAEDVLAGPITRRSGEHLCALHACGGLHDAALQSFRLSSTASYFSLLRAGTAPMANGEAGRRRIGNPARSPCVTPGRCRFGDRPRRGSRPKEPVVLRQAFDLFQREAFKQESYLPCLSMPAAIIDHGFEAFAAQAAAHHGLALPAGLDGERWMVAGAERAAQVRRRNLLRLAFGRVLELRIVLDRALWLAEQGFAVS